MLHKSEELAGILYASLGKDTLRYVQAEIPLPERHKTVLESEARANALPLLLALEVPSLLVQSHDLRYPSSNFGIGRVFVQELFQIPYEMNPTALVLPQMVVISTIEVADQDAFVSFSQCRFRHLMPTALVPKVKTSVRIGKAPHISVYAVLPPTGLVRTHTGTAPNRFPQPFVERSAFLRQRMQQFRRQTSPR